MKYYTEKEKHDFWNRIVSYHTSKGRPYGMTDKRLEKVKALVWGDDEYFWFNTIGRDRPDNFWSILHEVAIQRGIIKP